MKILVKLLIVFILLMTASCATDAYRDDSGRKYQFSPYSGYPADYWGNRSDYGVPLPGRQ